jgi:hypothetical protein
VIVEPISSDMPLATLIAQSTMPTQQFLTHVAKIITDAQATVEFREQITIILED